MYIISLYTTVKLGLLKVRSFSTRTCALHLRIIEKLFYMKQPAASVDGLWAFWQHAASVQLFIWQLLDSDCVLPL